ncbi:MAG: LamG-like jellyroll fold domain-containing protein [Velocimicrobium sp.]
MINKKKLLRGLALTLAVSTALSGMPVYAQEEAAKTNPVAVYNWDFESEDLGTATLEGGACIQEDEIKGNVLYLPGGSAGAGSMSLPENLFENLGTDGFTIAMWVKPSSDTGAYTKFFDASNSPLGESDNGGTWWTSPDFALATGGSVYDMTMYVGEAGKATTNCSKLKYDQHLTKGSWQYMVVTVSATEYKIYLNGVQITYQDAQQETKSISEVLPSLFSNDYLKSLKYASIGKSLYTSDNDFAGEIDDVNFYASVLNTEEISTLFTSYGDIINKKTKVFMTVNMAESTGTVKHSATGFLYGLGDDNVPSTNLMTAIKPYSCEQKPADGLQHPSGDFLEIADTFIQSGGKFIQIACPDIYANWPYEFESIPEYLEKLKIMVQQVKDAGYSDQAVYVPFNEPDGNWYAGINNSTTQASFFTAWKQAYDVIKSVDPNAKIAGSNLSYYNDSHMKAFVQFCAENDCIPDQITWHVLNDDLYISFPAAVDKFRSYEKTYWIDAGLTTEEKEIVINEYAGFTNLGVPGDLVKWIGLFEDEKVSACLAYWHISNNLSDLAADNNEPNGAWWLYKWYGEMSGNTLAIQTKGVEKTKFYGVASLDANKKLANVILGGVDGNVTLKLENVNQTNCFGSKVKVKLESTNWTGINGASDDTNLVKEEVCTLDGEGNLTITVDNMVAAAAYNVTISQADENAEVGVIREGAWSKTYEGELAVLSGSAIVAGKSTMYACSGTGQAQGLNSEGDSVTFQVEVPQDGYYKYEMVYGAATGNNTWNLDQNDPKNAVQNLFVDGIKIADMLLENTLSWYMSGMHTEYVYLTKGLHNITVEATSSEGKATLDCMYLTYVGDEVALDTDKNVKKYEAELSDFNILGTQTETSVTTDCTIPEYSAAGYVTGLDTSVEAGGGIRFTTYAKENGMYDLIVNYSSSKDATINYYIGNTALTLNNKIASKTAKATDGVWSTVVATVYLEKGINIVDLDASVGDLAVDTLTVSKAKDQSQTVTIEAEDCETIGDVTTSSNTYASNGKYVNQILADKDGNNALVVDYTAKKSGNYVLAIYQSNKELFGKHSYNAQMVDRYVTISVNGQKPVNVFFRNTYSDESFKSQVATVSLRSGNNQLKIYNDDARVLKNGVGGVNTCVNYTPNLDKFEITPVTIEQVEAKEADFTALNAILEKINALDKNRYTTDSYKALNTIVDSAKKLKDEVTSADDQNLIDQMVQKLNSAISALESSDVYSGPVIQKTTLTSLINAVEKAEGISRSNYTKDSLKAMDLAKERAEKLIKNKTDRTLWTEVDEAIAELENAINGLVENPEIKIVKKGSKTTVGNYTYKVTSTKEGSLEVAFVKSAKKSRKTIVVPDTVKISGVAYKVTSIKVRAFKNKKKLQKVVIGKNVTSIGNECFKNCKKLSKIQIKSTALKAVGKNALSGISKKAVIKVPKSNKKAYQKLFKGKGQKSTVKMK